VHSSTASTPSSRGLPVGPGRCRTPSQAAARPRRAKLVDRCSCGAASTFTTNAPCPRMARRVRLPRSKQTSTSGGSSDSELTALAVVPTGSPSSSIDVTIVTPVAKWPIACRNSDELTSAGDSSTAAIGPYPIISICKIAFRFATDAAGRPALTATCLARISDFIARFNSQCGSDDGSRWHRPLVQVRGQQHRGEAGTDPGAVRGSGLQSRPGAAPLPASSSSSPAPSAPRTAASPGHGGPKWWQAAGPEPKPGSAAAANSSAPQRYTCPGQRLRAMSAESRRSGRNAFGCAEGLSAGIGGTYNIS